MKLNQIINLHKGLTAFVVIGFMIFFDNIQIIADKILNGFHEEGKDYITIAFGCTGGTVSYTHLTLPTKVEV